MFQHALLESNAVIKLGIHDGYLERAWIRYHLGEYQSALEDCQASSANFFNYHEETIARRSYRRAVILMKLLRRSDAIADAKFALHLVPENKQYANLLRELSAAKSEK